jgi:hypothetical protein
MDSNPTLFVGALYDDLSNTSLATFVLDKFAHAKIF